MFNEDARDQFAQPFSRLAVLLEFENGSGDGQ
jgi:hypothetical protein